MRTLHCLRIALLVAVVWSIALDASAWPWSRRRVRHADKNKDGRVSAREYVQEKRFERQKRSEVNTPWEEKADRNKDGVVGPAEARQAHTAAYLKNRAEVDKPWETKADADADGRVDRKELREYRGALMDKNEDGKVDAAERHAFWRAHRARVNTPYEKRHDADGDGFINGNEARDMLRDLLRLINTDGRARVNTPLEREFDANGDGVIDIHEAKALREAIEDS